ncbi:MAG: hypothetical protein ABFS02_05185, partial [Pseudomonadota bacterium]
CDRPAPSVASGFRQSLPERRFGWLLKILSNQENDCMDAEVGRDSRAIFENTEKTRDVTVR